MSFIQNLAARKTVILAADFHLSFVDRIPPLLWSSLSAVFFVVVFFCCCLFFVVVVGLGFGFVFWFCFLVWFCFVLLLWWQTLLLFYSAKYFLVAYPCSND